MPSEQQLAFAIKAVNEASRQLGEVERDLGGLDRAASNTSSGGLSRLGKAGKMAGLAIAGLGVAAVGATAAFGVKAVRDFAKAGDEVQKMALRTGFSTEALSELRYAAELSGTSLDGLEVGVRRMQRTIVDAGDGTATAVDALDRLGVSFEDLQGLSPEEQFEVLTTALAGIEDPTLAAAAAQEIFGRQGTALLPMLSEGAEGLQAMRDEAHEMGVVFDQEAADSAAEFNDNMTRLNAGIQRAQMAVANALVPALNDLAEWLGPKIQDAAKTLEQWIDKIDTWFHGNSESAVAVKEALADAEAAFRAIPDAIADVVSAVQDVINVVKFLTNDFKLLEDTILPIVKFIAGEIKNNFEIVKDIIDLISALLRGDFSAAWEELKSLISNIWDSIEARIELAKELIIGVATNLGATIKSVIETPLNELKELVSGVFDDILGFFEDLDNKILAQFTKISTAAQAIGGAIRDGFIRGLDAAGGLLTGLGNAMQNVAKTAINQIIDAFNRAVEFTFKIPNPLGPDPTIRIDPPDIPHLARGGIVTRPTLAVIGEAGPEAVVPLGSGGSGPVGGLTVNINGGVVVGDLDELAYKLDRALRRMGREPLTA